MSNATHQVLAYYHFAHLKDAALEKGRHKEFFAKNPDIRCRIYLSEEGINGSMSGPRAQTEAYMAWMREDERYEGIRFKIQEHHENIFPRQTIKCRPLVAMGADIDLEAGGEHISPARWKEMLEKEENIILLDVRNDYEWDVGHFEGAPRPECLTFRDFPQEARDLAEKEDVSKAKVMMYCTGGIRCEYYSALLKEEGFENVYQLDGGVVGYGMEEGRSHWEGKLFTFDERLAMPISDEEHSVVGKCKHCGESSESFFNCANMRCNDLFLCCKNCHEKLDGCCKSECQESEYVRASAYSSEPKPFKRLHLMEDKQV